MLLQFISDGGPPVELSHHDILVRKLRVHSELSGVDEDVLRQLPLRVRMMGAGEDLVREGDEAQVSAVLMQGWLGRYQTLPLGRRQYLSIHMAGDWPDAQGLFLKRMDHAVCALGEAMVATVHHDHLRALFDRSRPIAEALWRETLIDAAIFRQAITNNSSRDAPQRLAHLLCELFYRAQKGGIASGNTLDIPLKQEQLGEALGLALVTVNRSVRALRATGAADLRHETLTVIDWQRLVAWAEFDPGYLNI